MDAYNKSMAETGAQAFAPFLPLLPPESAHLVLYDGACGLCNGMVRFVRERDPHAVFGFASLQSAAVQQALGPFGAAHHDPDPENLRTVYVVANARSGSPQLLSKSAAALFVAARLKAPWRWLRFLRVLPRKFLDWAYDRVAENRHRFSSRRESCPLPSAGSRS